MRKRSGASKICVLAFATGMLAAIGCNRSSAPTVSPEPPAAPSKVIVVQPKRQALKRLVEQPGAIQAYEETTLFARVPGYVRLAHDKDGKIIHDYGRRIQGPKFDSSGSKIVEPGEILAELVVPELEQRANLKNAIVRQTESELEQARKLLASAEANIATMDALVVEAKALYDRWESESTRITKLADSGTIDQQARDEIKNQFKAAGARVLSSEASVVKAKADRDKSIADVHSMQARIEVAKADALEAEAMLSYSKIRAPYDGVITSRKINSGDFVQPTSGHGDWLFKVARLDPVRVVVAVPEADADLINEKSQVRLTVQAVPGTTLTGTVARTSWALDIGSRTLHTEIDLPNKDGLLRPGMYVYAQIVNQLPEQWTLPVTAVVKQADGTVCFFVQDGKAAAIPVQIGRSDGQFIQVLKHRKAGTTSAWEDFTGSESIATRASGLADGQSVQAEAPSK
jgi:HlyD family secretion protein